MRKSSTLRRIFACFFLLCCTVLAFGNAHAQCPTCDCPIPPKDDAQYNPTPIPWNAGDTCVALYGDPACLYKICYIWRQTSSNNFDYGVTQVCYSDGCDVDSVTLLHDASWEIMQINPRHFPCGNTIQWTENMASCWHTVYHPGIPAGYKTVEMCDKHGWCLNKYSVQCGPPRTYTYISSVTTTYQCSSESCWQLPCPATR